MNVRLSPKKPKRRFVDPHVHLWDTANTWYHFPTPGNNFGMGDVSDWPMVYTLDDYFADMACVEIPKFIHITATGNAQDALDETWWIEEIAERTGFPQAILGTVDAALPIAEIERILDGQMKTLRYRGIRLLQGIDYTTEHSKALMNLLSERQLVYDAVAHPGGGIRDAAKAAAQHPDLIFAMEHTGWPLQVDDPAYFQGWKDEMAEFAKQPNTYCKLSGLGMTYHRTAPDIFRTYWEHCLSVFGASRCMFASNFPVDRIYGSFEALYMVFEETVAGLSQADQQEVFSGTAERVYRV